MEICESDEEGEVEDEDENGENGEDEEDEEIMMRIAELFEFASVPVLDENEPMTPRRLFPDDLASDSDSEADEDIQAPAAATLLLPPPIPYRRQYTSWMGPDGQIVYNSRHGNGYFDEDPEYPEDQDAIHGDNSPIAMEIIT